MAAMLETPSRIWRRIEAVEDRDMPSLPSLPPFEDSVDPETVIHHDYDDQLQEDEDPVTPHTRRRSFLLDVINSTARPRMKFRASFIPTASPHNVTTHHRVNTTPTLTPPYDGTVDRASFLSTASSHDSTTHHRVKTTPALTPPYDGTVDRASFISTASSHDLTTHHRVNTSFDPAMGFGAGAPGHGVGRFNAAKLNNYLHGLNRRLQQENENLIEKLKILEEVKKEEGTTSRRVSHVRTSLGNVQEDVAEGWLEEKAELGNMVEKLETELTTCMTEKKEVETALEQEKESRERDKVRWRERMTEVEQGVSGIIAGLEQKLQAAEKQTKKAEEEASQRVDEMAKELVEIRGDRDAAMERASKAERVLESGKDLGGALREANERVAQVMGDLRNANSQIKELEEEIMQSDGRIDDLEKDQREYKDIIADLEEELSSRSDALAADRTKMKQLEDTIRKLNDDLTSKITHMDEMATDLQRMESVSENRER